MLSFAVCRGWGIGQHAIKHKHTPPRGTVCNKTHQVKQCNPFLHAAFSAVKYEGCKGKALPTGQQRGQQPADQALVLLTKLPKMFLMVFPVTESHTRRLSSLFRGWSNAGICHGGLRTSQPLLFKETVHSFVYFPEHSDPKRPCRAWRT